MRAGALSKIPHHGVAELNGYFDGEPIWIVCTGTSLLGFPWEQLDDEITIAVNDAVYWLKDPTVHIFNDSKVCQRMVDANSWRGQGPWRKRMIARPEGWKYADGQVVVTRKGSVRRLWGDECGRRIRLYVYQKSTSLNLKMKHSTLYCRSTVAVSALQLAVRMGASWIGLLGADCYQIGRARYWWEPHDPKAPTSRDGEGEGHGDYSLDWNQARDWLKETAPHVKVVNYSPRSPLNTWPRADWRDVFQPKDKEAVV